MGKSKEKTMAIVKYDNKFNQLSLTNFRAIEMDLLMSLCSKTKEQDSRDVILTFEQIKNLSHYVPTSNQRFIQDLKSMNKKLMSLDFTYEDEHRVEQFVLFPDFVIDKDAHTLTLHGSSWTNSRHYLRVIQKHCTDYSNSIVHQGGAESP